MIRFTVCAASTVCKVERTRCPVSAAMSGDRHRLPVTDLPQEDHVRVLPQDVLERVGVADRIEPDLPLADHALVVPVQELDRVLDRDDRPGQPAG